MHLSPGASGEVGFLGIPPAHETVAVLNRAFFPGGVSPRVVDVASGNIFYLLRIQEFTSVVGGNGAYSSKRLACNHAFYRLDDIFLCDMVDEFDDITPALSVDKHKQPTFAFRGRDDSVHFVMSEAASLVRACRPVVECESAWNGLRGMRLRTFGFSVRVIRGLPVHDTDITSIDVVVPCRKTGDAYIRQLFLHEADSVIGRKFFINHMFFKNGGHLICYKHFCAFVIVIFIDFILSGERIVFGVFSSSPVLGVWNRDTYSPAVVFASPGFRLQTMHCRELSDCDPSPGSDEFIPVCGKNLPLSES